MDNRKSFQRLLDHAETMVQCGQEYEGFSAMPEARMQYDAALAVLNVLAADTTVARQEAVVPLERVHGLLASLCQRKREFEQAANHWKEQIAQHAKSFGDSASGLVDIYVSLCGVYLNHLNKVSDARAAAEKALEILAENGSQVSSSAIFVNYYLCLCHRSAGNKAAAAVALNRAVAMLDFNPALITPVEANVIRALASEFA